MKLQAFAKHPLRAKLIFNPQAGATRSTPVQIVDVIREMQAWNMIPEVCLVEPDFDLPKMVRDALWRGIRTFVVCGGDGTTSSIARSLAGTNATMGIVPAGTQNNTALSLGIPADIPSAIALLRTGRRIKVDMGIATCGNTKTPFMEVCSVGLVSTLFRSADDIQHGNLIRIGDFLANRVASPPADIHLWMDNQPEIHNPGYVVLVSNMPYIGFHYQIGPKASFNDGLLDVLYFADLTKLDLLGYVLQGVGEGKPEDPRIQHYHVRRIEIDTHPDMAVMVDGNELGEGRVSIEVKRQTLAVMVAQPEPDTQQELGEMIRQSVNEEAPVDEPVRK